jgi:iron complex transport system ATP-binding protein
LSGLSVEKLCFCYADREVLCEISFEARQGSFVGISGPNGSGKTTLLRLLQGLLRPSRGMISLDGMELARWSRKELAIKVAGVWQRTPIAFDFVARQLVLLGRTPYLNFMSWPTLKDEMVVESAMKKTDCLHISLRPLSELSAGEFQRVQIAAALAQEPQWILLDEPTSYLDPKQKSRLLVLLQFLRNQGVTIICVSHDFYLLGKYADSVLLLDEGKQIGFGSPADVLSPANLQKVFEWEFPDL